MNINRILNELKAALLCGLVIFIIAIFNTKGKIDIITGIIGTIIICLSALVAMRIKAELPFKLPAFAWASLIGLLIQLLGVLYLKYI